MLRLLPQGISSIDTHQLLSLLTFPLFLYLEVQVHILHLYTNPKSEICDTPQFSTFPHSATYIVERLVSVSLVRQHVFLPVLVLLVLSFALFSSSVPPP